MDVRLSLTLRERRSQPVPAEELCAALNLTPQRLACEGVPGTQYNGTSLSD